MHGVESKVRMGGSHRSVLMFTPIRFPYLRLVGQQIAPSINDGVVVRLSPHQ